MLPISAVSRNVPKPLTPSGSMMPLMRTCTLACSLRTWKLPPAAESWVTPGNRSTIFSTVAFAPCGSASIALRLIVVGAVPVGA